MKRFDLRSLHYGETGEAWRRLPVEVDPFVFGGLEYEVNGGAVDLQLTAGRVGDNVTLVGEFDAEVDGPCQRCLGEAAIPVHARAVDYVLHGESEIEQLDDEEDAAAEAGYVSNNILDLERWVRDLVAESLPEKLLCSEECRGLCPQCGANLNTEPDHRHEEP